jgi:hypothetical protein
MMRRHDIGVAASIFTAVIALTCFRSAMAQSEPKALTIIMTADELRAAGIAVGSAGARALPNSCAPTGDDDISVSNEMLTSFRSRGFSLESICIGLTSAFRFDPDTGRPVPFAAVADRLFPLNLPDCFSRAAALLDCRWLYDHSFGVRNRAGDSANLMAVGSGLDAIARNYLGRTGASGVYPSGECERSGNIFNVEVGGRTLCVILDKVVFSARLPLGYGYGFRPPEGGDPEEDKTDLSTYKKRSGASALWSDENTKSK